MFRAFGHEKSSVLDGGLPRWETEGYPLENTPPVEAARTDYPIPSLDLNAIKSERRFPYR
jgi:thiosulfate/3-mercaptopyruvate sulfurtransferase